MESSSPSEKIYHVKEFKLTHEGLKEFGHLLTNDTSRKMIMGLSEGKDMYLFELAKKLQTEPNKLEHHMKKMKELKLLKVTPKKISRKHKEHDYYLHLNDYFINVMNPEEEGKLDKIFNRKIVQVASVGIASVVSYFATQFNLSNDVMKPQTNFFDLSDIPYIVIILGLSIILILEKIKKKF